MWKKQRIYLISYVFTLWYKFEFMIFRAEIISNIKFMIMYIIFMFAVLWFLKVSNSSITKVIIGIFSVIYLKEYSMGPLQTILNNKISNSMPHVSILTFSFFAQIFLNSIL